MFYRNDILETWTLRENYKKLCNLVGIHFPKWLNWQCRQMALIRKGKVLFGEFDFAHENNENT